MDEPEAIRRVQAGDAEAFHVLVRRYQHRLFALVRSYVRGRDLHEDLVQDVFLRAFEGLAGFRSERGGFAAWLYQIARNRCRDVLRARARRPEASPAGVDAVAAPPAAAPAEARVEQALAALSPEQRTAFLLVEVHGFSVREAAAIEQVAEGTIKSRAARARAELRARLGTRHEAEA